MGRKSALLVLLLAGLLFGGWIVLGRVGGPRPGDGPPPSPPRPSRGLPAPSAPASRPPIRPEPGVTPNVILVSIDSLRPDHLGCYGYERETSPHIDALAKEGALFESAIASSPWTLPSHMAIFTSLPDLVHGVDQNGLRLAVETPLLAHVLREAGYATAGFYSGPYLHPAFGFDRGFDEYTNCTSYPKAASAPISDVLTPSRETQIASMEDVTGPRIHEEVSRWIEKRELEKPFFLFIHYWDVHFDYTPPPPYDALFDPDYSGEADFGELEFNKGIHRGMDPRDLQHLIALYDGEIRWTDEWIGRLEGLLRKEGLLDRTLLVITSDHGEEFFEHGEKGHQKSLFDEVLRVPLILRLPGKVPPGIRSATQVRTLDIFPTILELAGVDLPPGPLGRSLVPLLAGGAGKARGDILPPAFSELTMGPEGRNFRSLRTRSWKLIRDLRTGNASFYDLRVDPGEASPILAGEDPRAGEAAERLGKLARALEALEASLPKGPSGRIRELDPEVRERLRSLGYIR